MVYSYVSMCFGAATIYKIHYYLYNYIKIVLGIVYLQFAVESCIYAVVVALKTTWYIYLLLQVASYPQITVTCKNK